MIQPNSDLPKKRGGGGEEGRLGKNVEGLLTIKKKKKQNVETSCKILCGMKTVVPDPTLIDTDISHG